MIQKQTEKASLYNNLERMTSKKIVEAINKEDKKVVKAIEKNINQISKIIDTVSKKIKNGGRLFYIGAGTSGRLGVLDASECPPTYGIKKGIVIGLIAGGDKALRNSVESAEDSFTQGWKDLSKFNINKKDFVIGITASGSTPYVLGAINTCSKNNILTAGISCNKNSKLSKIVDYKVEAVVGPEFVTGSTRMKAGTAQKMALNMISTGVMIKLGRVKGNKMVDMALSNSKLVERGVKMIQDECNISYEEAKKLLNKFKNIRKAIESVKN